MTQNSLSPVVKSRISSSSGRTMRVENRSLARTGTMSSFEYFTTRAAASVAARAGIAAVPTRQRKARLPKKDFIVVTRCIVFLLRWIYFVTTTWRRAETRTGERNDPKRSAQHQRGGEGDSKPGQSEVEGRYESRKKCEDQERSSKTWDDENPEDEPNYKYSHGFAPASTSSPFSNP